MGGEGGRESITPESPYPSWEQTTNVASSSERERVRERVESDGWVKEGRAAKRTRWQITGKRNARQECGVNCIFVLFFFFWALRDNLPSLFIQPRWNWRKIKSINSVRLTAIESVRGKRRERLKRPWARKEIKCSGERECFPLPSNGWQWARGFSLLSCSSARECVCGRRC